MRTPTVIEALHSAIDMLEKIARGGSYNVVDYHERLRAMRQAREAYHDEQLKAARARAQLRELSRQYRGAGASQVHTLTQPEPAANNHSVQNDHEAGGIVLGEVKP